MGKLDGKVAIVTGAAGGIGAATAALFLREGAAVMLVDREDEPLAELAQTIGGARVAYVTADVSDPAATRSYVDETVRRFGGLDVLFANAGIEGRLAPVLEYPLDELDRVLAVNVRGVFLGVQLAARYMADHGGGSIVITSSVGGLVASRGLCAYIASKHAVIGLMKTAAVELAPLGIRVNCVNPGPIENRMTRSVEEQASPGHPERAREGYLAKVPMDRYGTNEEVANLALFLASDDSSYCTGAVFLVDGGYLAL